MLLISKKDVLPKECFQIRCLSQRVIPCNFAGTSANSVVCDVSNTAFSRNVQYRE